MNFFQRWWKFLFGKEDITSKEDTIELRPTEVVVQPTVVTDLNPQVGMSLEDLQEDTAPNTLSLTLPEPLHEEIIAVENGNFDEYTDDEEDADEDADEVKEDTDEDTDDDDHEVAEIMNAIRQRIHAHAKKPPRLQIPVFPPLCIENAHGNNFPLNEKRLQKYNYDPYDSDD